MSAQTRQRCYAIEPLTGGGWRLTRYLMTGGTRSACQNSTDYPADHRTDPTGEAAYEQALHAAEIWRQTDRAADSPNRPDSGPAARRWPTLTLYEERAP